ncbi:glycosyltransferase [Fictibacillus sp. B-59209]|uniref:glycosyltransferase family 2 protein n=1 Tax=Fictibacillus sp. B-59209 TaxID=3024873 RepID=UPI002E22EEA5|nr:glycosyltransferase [Fictibacillus sp. B-59209]
MEYAVLFFFFLSIAFPIIHSFNCLPLFQKRKKRYLPKPIFEKSVSILIPCYNEEKIIATSVENMKTLTYSSLDIIYINDGSTDATLGKLNELLQLKESSKLPLNQLKHKKVIEFYKSELYPNIYVLDKVNGGKADALNAGIEYSSNELVVTLDADTIMTDHSLPAINETFEEQNVVAAGGMVHVLQTKTKNPFSGLTLRGTNLLIRAQALDFLRAFYITKVSHARFGALSIISGAFGIFRKQVLLNVGGYRTTIGEDIDITLKIQRHISGDKNKKVTFIPDAVCYTELPENLWDLFKQRVRWQKAFIDCVIHFRSFLGKNLFTSSVSFFYIFEAFISGTLAVYFMTSIFVVDGFALHSSVLEYVLIYVLYIFIFGLVYDMVAIGMGEYHGYAFQEKDTYPLLATILFDIFIFRIVTMVCVAYGSIAYFFNRDWNKVSRTGREYQADSRPAA